MCLLAECEQEAAQVFISYQWDSQDEARQLRDRLERSGFTCWMDVGQLGGGDHLYAKIDQALRGCKVCDQLKIHAYIGQNKYNIMTTSCRKVELLNFYS